MNKYNILSIILIRLVHQKQRSYYLLVTCRERHIQTIKCNSIFTSYSIDLIDVIYGEKE